MKIHTFSLLLAGIFGLTACSSTNCDHSAPTWHSIAMKPDSKLPIIHPYNKINPVWWFKNIKQPNASDWYLPDKNPAWRNFRWRYGRNPLDNFSKYVIGIADKDSTRSGYHPESLSNPSGGWNFSVTHRNILYLPFIDYSRNRFEFYFGWRQHGDFGIKLNFKKQLRKRDLEKIDTGAVVE